MSTAKTMVHLQLSPADRPLKKKKKSRSGKGFQKHTPELMLGPPGDTIDTLKVFIFSLHIYYCTHLEPPIEQGTLAEVAVLKTFMGTYCKNHLLRSIKTRFQVTHDIHPRYTPTTCTHDTHPRHAPTMHTHGMHPRYTPTIYTHDMHPRCIPTAEMDQQKSRCGLHKGPLRLDKGGTHL